MADRAIQMGTDPIGKLLIRQAVPASIGILVMSLNILIDTIFVGQWIGANAIAAINVVLPVSFFIAALGMSIGMGGGSIISRALGSDNAALANKVFGNQITLTLISTLSFMGLGLFFLEAIIPLFGGKGALYPLAKIYYIIVVIGVPVLGFCMMGNNTIRAEGSPKTPCMPWFCLLYPICFSIISLSMSLIGAWKVPLGQPPFPMSFAGVISSIFLFPKNQIYP